MVPTTDRTGNVGYGFSAILDHNKAEMAKIDDFKNQKITALKRNIVFGGMGLATFIFFILFATQILSGVLALIATLVFSLLAFYGIKFLKAADPLIRQKTKNLVLKKMVAEARNNAVQQLDNQVLENAKRLERARAARDKMGAAVQSLKSKIDPANEGTPIYQKKVEMLNKVEIAYDQIKTMLAKGAAANKKFEKKVIQYKDMESFANDVQEAMSFFEDSGSIQLENVLSLEAFGHIEEEFNVALVSIENKTQDMKLDED